MILDHLSGPHPVTWKTLNAELKFPWRSRDSTCYVRFWLLLEFPACWPALRISASPGPTIVYTNSLPSILLDIQSVLIIHRCYLCEFACFVTRKSVLTVLLRSFTDTSRVTKNLSHLMHVSSWGRTKWPSLPVQLTYCQEAFLLWSIQCHGFHTFVLLFGDSTV